MSHYSEDPYSMRVDFFRENGSWYCTEAVKWTGEYKNSVIQNEFAKSVYAHINSPEGLRLRGLVAVCLEPYHEHTFPLMMKVDYIITLVTGILTNGK